METRMEKTVVLTVLNKMGLHARPAAMIVRAANKHPHTDLWVKRDSDQINGKSIMGLMMLAAAQGTQLEIIAVGPEADIVLSEIQKLFENNFDEE
jgi:phosphocarrier protein HPr